MGKWNLRLIAVSFGVCSALGVGGGLLFAWLGRRELWYGLGTGLLLVGLVALALGSLAATEPKEGWATRRGRMTGPPGERHSVVARLGGEPEEMSSWEMLAWGLAVGGGLLILAMGCFALAV
jgi:hypothetical protein